MNVTKYWRSKQKRTFEVVEELQNQLSLQRFQVEHLQAELVTLRQLPARTEEAAPRSSTGAKRGNDTSQTSANKKRKIVRTPVEHDVEDDLVSLHPKIGQEGWCSFFLRHATKC